MLKRRLYRATSNRGLGRRQPFSSSQVGAPAPMEC